VIDENHEVQNRWEDIFRIVNPKHLTIVYAPPLLGILARLSVRVDVHREFRMPYCILSLILLFQKPFGASTKTPPPLTPTLLSHRPWTSLLLNKGSFLRAYASPDGHSTLMYPSSLLSALTSLPSPALAPFIYSPTYIAIFTFGSDICWMPRRSKGDVWERHNVLTQLMQRWMQDPGRRRSRQRWPP